MWGNETTLKDDPHFRWANTLFVTEAELPYARQPISNIGTTIIKTMAHLLFMFNNFACNMPSPCVPPIVPRLGQSARESYPFNPVSNTEKHKRYGEVRGLNLKQFSPQSMLTQAIICGTLLHFKRISCFL